MYFGLRKQLTQLFFPLHSLLMCHINCVKLFKCNEYSVFSDIKSLHKHKLVVWGIEILFQMFCHLWVFILSVCTKHLKYYYKCNLFIETKTVVFFRALCFYFCVQWKDRPDGKCNSKTFVISSITEHTFWLAGSQQQIVKFNSLQYYVIYTMCNCISKMEIKILYCFQMFYYEYGKVSFVCNKV